MRKILKWVFIACIAFGAIRLSGPLLVNILFLFIRPNMDLSVTETASIGIIGGADGPTSVLVAVTPWGHYVLPAIVLIVGLLGLYCLRKK